jgi:hypothetical protein
MCHYKLWNKNSLKGQLSDFTCLHFHFYSHYIKVYIYFSVKFCTFGFILKKSATLATDFHFHSDYVISYVWLNHAHSIYAVFRSVVLGMQHDRNSRWLTKLSSINTNSQLGILQHGGCLIDK